FFPIGLVRIAPGLIVDVKNRELRAMILRQRNRVEIGLIRIGREIRRVKNATNPYHMAPSIGKGEEDCASVSPGTGVPMVLMLTEQWSRAKWQGGKNRILFLPLPGQFDGG